MPLVETTSNDLGGVITAQTVEDMPVNGRDYTKLIYLNPGVAGSPDQITDSPGSFGEFSMNGARGRSNNYLLDGTDMNDGYRNDPAINEAGVFGTPATILPIDAVAEVNVLSNFQPEYGRNAGAVVNIVTKSGTNNLHGSAAEYFRNSALDARNYFDQYKAANPRLRSTTISLARLWAARSSKTRRSSTSTMKASRSRWEWSLSPAYPHWQCREGSRPAADRFQPPVGHRRLLARKPWPAPNLARGTRALTGYRLGSFAIFQQTDQLHRQDRPEYQRQQYPHRPVLLRRQRAVVPASAHCHGWPVAGL